jgi:hypothetical protein
VNPLNVKPGDVLFVWGHGFFPDMIEIITHGPSHVAMFINPTRLEEAQAGEPTGEIDLSFYLNGNARLEVWGDPTLTDTERLEMVKFAHTLYGKKYDYILIPLELAHFKLGLPLGWYHNPNKYICSDDVYTVALHVNHIWSKVPKPAPIDLINGGILQKKIVLKGST